MYLYNGGYLFKREKAMNRQVVGGREQARTAGQVGCEIRLKIPG
jgi:hypothetical protein